MPPGQVPRRWLRDRCMGSARLEGVYCDLGHADSLAHLRQDLSLDDRDLRAVAASYGLTLPLDD